MQHQQQYRQFLTSQLFKWGLPCSIRHDVIRQKKKVESGLINVRNPADVNSIDVVGFCILTPSKKQSGAMSFFFRCSRAQKFVTIILSLGYYAKKSEASDDGDELEYRLTKFAAYHIHRFTFGIKFGHASFLKERDEWLDFFAIFLVTANSHNFYDSFS